MKKAKRHEMLLLLLSGFDAEVSEFVYKIFHRYMVFGSEHDKQSAQGQEGVNKKTTLINDELMQVSSTLRTLVR